MSEDKESPSERCLRRLQYDKSVTEERIMADWRREELDLQKAQFYEIWKSVQPEPVPRLKSADERFKEISAQKSNPNWVLGDSVDPVVVAARKRRDERR